MFGALWLLVMHGVDMQWLVMPMASTAVSTPWRTHPEILSLSESVLLVRETSHGQDSIVPLKDPYLKDTMKNEDALS